MTAPDPLREDEVALAACWYPSTGWHVIADGCRHVSSHGSEADARTAILRLDQVCEGRGK